MSSLLPSKTFGKVEKARTHFRCPSPLTVPAELIPNARPKFGVPARGKGDRAHRVVTPSRPNGGRTAEVGRIGVGEGRDFMLQWAGQRIRDDKKRASRVVAIYCCIRAMNKTVNFKRYEEEKSIVEYTY